jgi:UDP-N-acetylglucosamine transferase subunit ALG13
MKRKRTKRLKKKPYIFVIVGTGPYQFNRLLQTLDNLATKKNFKYDIVAQRGNTPYKPKNYEYFKFTPNKQYKSLMRNAAIVINHGGAGSAVQALTNKKPLIIFPREVRYGEHRNDSSVLLGETFEKRGLAITARNERNLSDAIKRAGRLRIRYSKDTKLIGELNKYLKSL